MTLKTFGIGAVIFLVGVGFGGAGKTQTVTKEVPVEKVVEKTVEVEKNLSTWQELKTVDDQGFVVAASNMVLCSEGFKAVASLDTDKMNEVAADVKTNTDTLNNLGAKRQDLLKKLGY